MVKHYEIIKRPIVTEKSMKLREAHRYTFEVAKTANKIEIAKAIEAIYKVTVTAVATVHVMPKHKRVGQHAGFTKAYKKAYVTLKPGDAISGFEV